MKKQVKGFIIGVVFMFVLSNIGFASRVKETIEIVFNSINLQVNGKIVDTDNILYNETTYVPIRKAAEMLGKEVSWNNETRTANIIDQGEVVLKDIVKNETVNYENGDSYVGETKNGIRHGKGTYYYSNGNKYVGDWFSGFESGKGVSYLSNGKLDYEIDFMYGTESGKIIYYYEDGGRYEGRLDNGVLSSYGSMYFKDGSKYEGDYKDDKEDGLGKYTFSNGDYFEGEFKEGKFFNGVGEFSVNGVTNKVYYANGIVVPSNNTTNFSINADIVESRIDGEFTGWDGDTIFKLQNGQIWQQTSYNYTYSYKYSPKVLIYKSGINYKMKVDGLDREITVKRLK